MPQSSRQLDPRGFLRDILRWALVALVAGVLGGAFVFGLERGLDGCAGLRERVPDAFVWLLPAAGGLLVGLALWRLGREAEGEPMPKYIHAVNRHGGRIPFAHGASALLGSFVTLGTGGSGGTTGPAVLASAYLASAAGGRTPRLLRFLGLSQDGCARLAVSAAAAAISAILRAPIGGGILAVELLFRKNLEYESLFTALLSSVAGYLVYGRLSGDYRPLFEHAGESVPGLGLVPAVAGVILAVVVLSLGFVWVYEKIVRFFLRLRLAAPLRLAIGGIAVGLLALGLMQLDGEAGRAIFGTGRRYMLDVVGGGMPPVALWILAGFVVAKILATCATIGTGNVAGFVLPTVILGAFAGHIAAVIAGPGTAGDATAHGALLAAGIPAALAAVLNCPLAAAIIGLELFGLRFAWIVAAASFVSYKLTENRAIYQLDLAASRVLVADDDPNLRRLVARLFERSGYAVDQATDGLAAHEALCGGGYDLAVVDRMMPKLHGDDLVRRLRGDPATERLPVIMLTGLATDRDRVEGIDIGADDYLTKPFHPPELLARAKRLIERSRPQHTQVLRRH